MRARAVAIAGAGITLYRNALEQARMPWNGSYYPASMKNLPPAVRAKAIEIANALLEAGRPEGQAIRIGIAGAKRWAAAGREKISPKRHPPPTP
jgi:hypothetical protein